MTTNLTTIRQALRDARERCRTAKSLGEWLNFQVALADGRTLHVSHAEAAESHPGNRCYLFGAWTYQVDNGRSRRLTL